MAGSLIKIDEEIVTSAVASVTLGGSDWDSSYDVYMVRYNNVLPVNDNVLLSNRVTVSGTADTTANYDYAYKLLQANTTFSNVSATNDTDNVLGTNGTGGNESTNGIMYLFNFNNASEYSFGTVENTLREADTNLRGIQGGYVHTVAQACDGIQFFYASGNIASGTFTLYGLKK
jgi:hypothetical protein